MFDRTKGLLIESDLSCIQVFLMGLNVLDLQIKDRESAQLLAGYEDKESHEGKKATKDSLV